MSLRQMIHGVCASHVHASINWGINQAFRSPIHMVRHAVELLSATLETGPYAGPRPPPKLAGCAYALQLAGRPWSSKSGILSVYTSVAQAVVFIHASG